MMPPPSDSARTVEVYLSVESIWTHVGFRAMTELFRTRTVDVVYRPVPLQPLFAQTGGVPFRQRPEGRKRYRDYELQRWCERRQMAVDLSSPHLPPAAQIADRLVIACCAAGHDPARLLQRLLDAAWCRRLDVAQEDVLLEALRAADLPVDLLGAARSPGAADSYAANLATAVDAGVFGLPSFVRGGEVFWGQDRLDSLDEAITTGRAAFQPFKR